MRRTFAGLFFGVAYVALSITIGGWLLGRTAFNPDRSGDAAYALLQDTGIRHELASQIGVAASSTLGQDPVAIEAIINTVTDLPASTPVFRKLIHDIHAQLIGDREFPVQIKPGQLVQILRTEQAASLPTVILDVPRVQALSALREALAWAVPIAALAALALLVLGFAAHPERTVVMRSFGIGLIALGGVIAALGYVVPKFLVPALSDSPYARIPPILADEDVLAIIGLAIVVAVVGAALVVGSGMVRQNRRWSTPVSTYRYSEQRRWG